jgi:uncharacterized membrane protein
MNTDAIHPLTTAYLQELESRARQLPPDQARELVEDIREHLDSALRADSSEAEVRSTLDRLGSPAEVVAAAGPPMVAATPARPTTRTVEISAIVCLVAAELLVILWPLATLLWVAGIVLLAVSKIWTGRQKVLGLAGLASGYPVVTLILALSFVSGSTTGSCSGSTTVDGAEVTDTGTCTVGPDTSSSYGWLALAIGIAYLAFQGYTIWRLTRPRRTA